MGGGPGPAEGEATVGDEDETERPEAKPVRRLRGSGRLAAVVSAAVVVTAGGVEAVPHIKAEFSAGSQTTHSGNQSGTGNSNQQSGSDSNSQSGRNNSGQGGKDNTQANGKGTAQKAGANSNQVSGNQANQRAGANSIQNGSGDLTIGGGATGGTGGTGGVGGTGGTGGQGGTGGRGGNGVVLTAPAAAPRAAAACTAKAVVSVPATTGSTVSGRVSIPCQAPSGEVYYLIVELDHQGTDNTTNYYPKQEFTAPGNQPFTFNAQSVGSRKVFVVRVDDGEATQLEQMTDGEYLFSLPGSLVSNVVTTTRTA
jgi:hypothetical protein